MLPIAGAAAGLQVAATLFGAMGAEDAAQARATQIAQQETNSEWALQNESNNLAVNEWAPVGVGQNRAAQWKLKTDNLIGTITAVAAANGGGSDPGIINLMSRIQTQGNVNAQTEVANGLMKQRAVRNQINANEWSIKNGATAAGQAIDSTLSAGDTLAMGTILGGATDLFAKYGSTVFGKKAA